MTTQAETTFEPPATATATETEAEDYPLGPVRHYVVRATEWDQLIDRDTPGAYATARDEYTHQPMAWAVDGAREAHVHPHTRRPVTFAITRKQGDIVALPERHPHVNRLAKRDKWGRCGLELVGSSEHAELAEIEARQKALEAEKHLLKERVEKLQAELDAQPAPGEVRDAPRDPAALRL